VDEYLGKPTGILLKDHVQNVVEEAENIIRHRPFVFSKYKNVTQKDLAKRLSVVSNYHDEGKKTLRWQTYCRKAYEHYLKTGKVGNHLKDVHLRHELVVLPKFKANGFSNPNLVAIAAHHQKFSHHHERRWKEAEAIEVFNHFKRISYHPRNFQEALLANYEYAGARYYLQLADHRASIKEETENNYTPTFSSFNYRFPFKEKRSVQKIVEEHWDKDLFLIRAPTGAGKTDAALLWAQLQIENRRADRLVIAMPTRFTSNALSINVTESLSKTGLYHSSAWFTQFYEKAQESKKQEQISKVEHEFARLLETPVTVCTIDHLLIALTLSREDHHGILFNLAHSCVVIDEADFYDDFTQANILVLLQALKILQVPVMIMSASLPESSLKMYQQTGYDTKEILDDKSDIHRKRCTITKTINYEKVEDLEDLLLTYAQNPLIIYANTVNRAIEYYKWFEDHDIEATLYHSRYTEPHKKDKEEELIGKIGEDAWKGNIAYGVAILTQIGEMSVNISTDVMISDICPIDRLVQRAGRLSRFNKQCGKLYLLVPQQKNELYPAPYGNYIRKEKRWEPNLALLKTLNILETKDYSAEDFVNLINDVYNEFENFSVSAEMNSDKLKNHVISNWLILPEALLNEDDESTNFWKSRNIPHHIDVFVEEPLKYFHNYRDYMYFKNQFGVACPLYLVEPAKKTGQLIPMSITVGDDEFNIYFTNKDVYSYQTGLYFKRAEIIDQFL